MSAANIYGPVKREPEILPRILCGSTKCTARQLPYIRKAADQRRYTFGIFLY